MIFVKLNILWINKIELMRINTFDKLISIPKSFYVSLRLCGLKRAFKLPILVRFNCKLIRLNGKAIGGGKIDIGFGNIGIFDKCYQRSILEIKGKIVINGYAHFGPGCRFVVGKDGTLTLGNNVANSAACSVICMKSVHIGADTIISWDTLIMDTDFHRIYNCETDTMSIPTNDIVIESNCWLGARSVILKGAYLRNNSIVAANTTVTRKYDVGSVLIAGNPGIVKRHGLKPIP